MDPYNSNRFRNRKPLSFTERFLGVPSSAPPLGNPSSSSAADDELIEDDVVFFNDDSTEPSSSSSPVPNHHHHHHSNSHHHKGSAFGSHDAFGILAALPENDPSPNNRNGSHLFHNHKASVSVSASSSSSSSSSRLIPSIPKPPPDRTPSSTLLFHQSAPVNVPMMSPARARRHREFDDDVDLSDDEEMLPPHEIVARNSAQSPMLAYSVLEGVGRTLKGRDLRQVRNAVWRQTGFYG